MRQRARDKKESLQKEETQLLRSIERAERQAEETFPNKELFEEEVREIKHRFSIQTSSSAEIAIVAPFENTYEVKVQHVRSAARKLTPQEEAALRRQEIEQLSSSGRSTGCSSDKGSTSTTNATSRSQDQSFLSELQAKSKSRSMEATPQPSAGVAAKNPFLSELVAKALRMNGESAEKNGVGVESLPSTHAEAEPPHPPPISRGSVKTSKNVKDALEKQFSQKFAQIAASSPTRSPARKSYFQSTIVIDPSTASSIETLGDGSGLLAELPPVPVKAQSLVREAPPPRLLSIQILVSYTSKCSFCY
jgi:hypothetical protein